MKPKTVYNRPRLDKFLDQVLQYPLTCIVAGAGYGKTTAVSDYLRRNDKEYAYVLLTSSDNDLLWDKLCTSVEKYSNLASDSLRILGFPASDWQLHKALMICSQYASKPFIICIDDYQLLPMDSPVHKLVETLAFENVENLHLLLVSRSKPNICLNTLVSKDLALIVGTDIIAFNYQETREYLKMRGLRLTDAAIQSICKSSEGWISAIYLQGEGIRSGGVISSNKGIDALFEENLMQELLEYEREMLYRLSGFSSFPLEMATKALGTERIRDIIGRLEKENTFITEDDNNEYRFHPLFRSYLSSHCPHDEQQKTVYKRACFWYISRNDRKYFYSVKLVKKAEYVEEFLSFFNKPNATRLNYYDINEISELALELPQDYCIRFPFPYLQICFFLLLSGKDRYRLFAEKLMKEMQEYFKDSDYQCRNIILGEMLVIGRVSGYGQIEPNQEPLKEAAVLLEGRESEILNPSDPFTFGLPMLLNSEYLKPGTLDEAVKRCQYNPYELVSDSFGQGSEALVISEAALLRCDFEKSKSYAEQAIVEASKKEQFFIISSAYSTLMRRSLFLGDIETALVQLENIRNQVILAQRTLANKRLTINMLRETLELAECFLNTSLKRINQIPLDFINGSHQIIMAEGLGVIQVYCARAMFATGDYLGAMRQCQKIVALPSISAEVFFSSQIILSLCEEHMQEDGNNDLVQALTLAQKDGVILLFAEYPQLLPMLKGIKNKGLINDKFISEVISSCEKNKAVTSVLPLVSAKLSKRELEVLRYTSLGKTRKEIAVILCVTEETIKKHLAMVYQKLDAKGKTDAISKARLNKLF